MDMLKKEVETLLQPIGFKVEQLDEDEQTTVGLSEILIWYTEVGYKVFEVKFKHWSHQDDFLAIVVEAREFFTSDVVNKVMTALDPTFVKPKPYDARGLVKEFLHTLGVLRSLGGLVERHTATEYLRILVDQL